MGVDILDLPSVLEHKFFKNNNLQIGLLCSGGDLNPILGFCFPLFSMVFPRKLPSG